MTTVTQAIEKRDGGPVSLMWGRRKHFRAVLPASVDVEAFLGTAAGALFASDIPGKDVTLMKCAQANPDSLMVALMRCAALGHLPGTDEFYLTPRRVKGRLTVLGIEGYRGVIERMYRSGAVAKVVVREVCAKDQFRYVEGADDRPIHSFGGEDGTGAGFFGAQGFRDRGEMVGVYAYAELIAGAVSRVVLLGRDDVHAARASGGWKPDDEFSPWNRMDSGPAHPEFQGRSMWWKTGAKRLEPWVPTSAEYRREQLRASATAADLSGMRSRVPELPAGNGHSEPQDIVDAETVEDPTPAEPAGGTGSTGAPAPARTAPRAGKGATGDLDKLLRQLPLGEPADVKALMQWQCGRDYPTGQQVVKVAGFLRGHLDACQGDTAEAASAIWAQYRAIREQDAQGEPGAAEASDG